jgi:hypothetical protein
MLLMSMARAALRQSFRTGGFGFADRPPAPSSLHSAQRKNYA